MIERYTRPVMQKLWSPENKFKKWLEVEIAVCEAWHELGEIPDEALKKIKERAGFDLQRIEEVERTVKHDVIAFLQSLSEHIGPESRYVHKGLTSSDIVDTALSLLMREAADIIIENIKNLLSILKEKALRYKDIPCMGRTHGVHAEPMSFGLKFLLWYSEMERNLERIKRARDVINAGKISGAVGTFSNIPPEIEEKVCKKLGLNPEPVANQIVQRDRHAEYLSAMAITAATIEKISLEVRHLQRTEVLEAEEPFTEGQKGSSAMPHKRNPVGAENLCGLSRVVKANLMAALDNIALWHERDISHSSVERVIIPDSTILIDYMLVRLTGIIKDLQVYPERMMENIARSYGLYNSQRILLMLTEKGLTGEEAYKYVQRNAMKSWKEKQDFKQLVLSDSDILQYLNPEEIERAFDLGYYMRNIDYIYKRVLGD
ncbi:MAG: adenylosuccinate lyase [Thermodesulfovibrionales bacterium]|nr:adenylosuccinate lyase [Thermodesulfovibrionales bacterium]